MTIGPVICPSTAGGNKKALQIFDLQGSK